MAAEICGMCPFEAMDHLWFYHLFISSKSPNYSSKNISRISVIVSNQQISSSSSSAVASSKVDETKRKQSDHVEETTATTTAEDRATKLYLVSRKSRSHSSSPTSKQSRLRKTMSCCKSLGDLELQEVKGFMDLGFVFKKHNLSSHVISLIPGLQRINALEKDLGSQTDLDEEEKRGGKMRPYLSESWLVKMPDSPLILSLRISRVCNDSDKVKKHLKDWARTVAAAIQQES